MIYLSQATISAIAFIAVLFCDTLSPDCGKYKTGKFYINNKANGQKITIERNDSLQIETNEVGDITILKVNWTGPCRYELFFNYMTPKEVSKSKDVQRVFDSNGDIPFQVKILGGTESYYVYEASRAGLKNLQDTVWLLK